ncbi:Integrase catalytic domain-containing protein [Citrus sinensis]|uniref:Integrase catalytic domain-containing protein n=1 Tax=Citrus sinensis TaxID=2711 RepID=A0ACB8HZU1_CITSI|nr:Integrase catalytic domain-containing protein [Citrus sinensis]
MIPSIDSIDHLNINENESSPCSSGSRISPGRSDLGGVSSSVSDEKKRQIQNKAHSSLILSLSDSILREISEEKTAIGIENVKITDEDKALFLLSLLPKIYEGFVDTMLYGRTTLTLEDVKASLSSKEIQKNNGHEDSNSEGHYIRDCTEKKNDEKERTGDAAVASDDSSDDGYHSADLLVASNINIKGQWVLDSGCSFHLCPDKSLFYTYESVDGGRVLMGNNNVCKIIGMGSVKIEMFDGSVKTLCDVRHAPRLKRNLISLGMLDSMGYCFKSEYGGLKIMKGTEMIMKGVNKNGLYVLEGSSVPVSAAMLVVSDVDRTMLWHLKLGHMSIRGMQALSKQGLLSGDRIDELDFSENCIFGKAHRSKFPKGMHISKQPLDYVHADLWGPAQVPSLSGGRYFMSFWAEAISTASYMVNKSPSATISFKTPEELWSGKPGIYEHLRVFGCLAYVHVRQGKLDARAIKGVFVGYPDGVKGYKVWCREANKCLISTDVQFNEVAMINNPDQVTSATDISTSGAVYLLLYVDDILIAGKNLSDIEKLKNLLNGEFEMKDLGNAKRILGIDIVRDIAAGTLFLSQSRYTSKVLERFQMMDSKPVLTPLGAQFKLSDYMSPTSDAEEVQMADIPYSQVVGSLMYAMVCTRADIAYAVNVVSRFMSNPGKLHWDAVKWVMRYLKGTLDHGLMYGKSKHEVCEVRGWKATLQHIVALSSTEAEFVAATKAVKESMWLKGLLNELWLKQRIVEIFCDNQSAIQLIKNQVYHERTKHIDVKLHFIRDEVTKGSFAVIKIHTDTNPANMLTKVLPTTKFKFCVDLIGVGGSSSS